MNPRRTRLTIALVATIAVVAAILTRPPDPPPIEIAYAYTPDAAELLEPLIDEFNDDGVTADGRRVVVEPMVRQGISSGEAQRRIARNTLQPVVWTPASSLWSSLLAEQNGLASPLPGPSLVQSPQVVAIFHESYQDLVDSSSTNGGDGPPQLGDVLAHAQQDSGFQWAHTDPTQSTSGLSAVLAEFHLAAGAPDRPVSETEVGTVDTTGSVVDRVRGFEHSVDHYVDIARDFAVQWCDEFGSAFADAAYMQETTYLHLIRDERCRGQFTALYPSDARLVADYPYVVLDQEAWVSTREGDAAQVFGEWLQDRLDDSCGTIRREGLRRGDCVAHDVPQEGRRRLATTLPVPPPSVLRRIKDHGTGLRRPAKVMLVVDESVDMLGQGRAEALRDVLRGEELDGQDALLGCLTRTDSVGLITFGGAAEPVDVVELGSEDAVSALRDAVKHLDATRGRAALYDAIQRAVTNPTLREDTTTINTVIVLAAGTDRGSTTTLRELEDEFHLNPNPPQLVVVPYGRSSLGALKHLVHISIGRFYDGEFSDITGVREFVCDYL
jgi:hypothetical protein